MRKPVEETPGIYSSPVVTGHQDGSTVTTGTHNDMTATLTANAIEKQHFAALPESMQIAQRAIQLPEVQKLIKQLSIYNLGVCMPHMHPREGVFVELPTTMVALERSTEFIPSKDADPRKTIPVAWRWSNDSVIISDCCGSNCGV